ncbi:MAG: thioredoxin domain-containing protein [Desulfosarcinaceae bacterium]|nr:thioredoxin domain-containing protein [Desulfosarcinaceae bacterium]
MTRFWKLLLITGFGVLLFGAVSIGADMEGEVVDTRMFAKPPIDMLLSTGGEYLYVLLPGGQLDVYNRTGERSGRLKVDPAFKQLRQGPSEDMIWLSAPTRTDAQLLAINVVRELPTAGSPSQGPVDAPVTIVIFSDFECGFCARMAEMLTEVRVAYPEEVRLVFKNYPLRGHRFALRAAQAALAAGTMGRFWEFHDALYENFDQLNEQKLDEIRASLNLDKDTFAAQLQAPQVIDAIRADMRLGREVKVTGTPTVFVNGRRLRKPSMENFHKIIGEQLGSE